MSGLKARSGPPGNSNAIAHGLWSLKRMLNGDGLDKRTSLYRALAEKERELVAALGGDPSPQERTIIGDTVKVMLYIGSLDAYLTGLKSLVRKGKVHAVLSERTRLAAHLRENLKTVGLKRIQKTLTLAELLAQGDGDGGEEEQGDGGGDPGGPESEGT